MSKKFLLMFLFSLCGLSNLKPLSDDKVNLISGGAGISSGLVALGVVGVAYDFRVVPVNTFVSIGTGIATGAIVGFGLNWYLKKYHTPKGRYNLALNFVDDIKDDYIFSKDVIKEEEFINYINSAWTGRWPVVCAKNHYSSIKNKLANTSNSLNKAINELKDEKKSINLMNECKILKDIVLEYFDLIQKRIGIIVNNKNYNFQMNLYHQHQEHEKQLQQVATQHSLDRWGKSKDRWSKEKIAKEKMQNQTNIAKEKMQHQTNLSNNVGNNFGHNNNNQSSQTQTHDQGTQTGYQSNQQNDFYPTQENFYPDLNTSDYNPDYNSYDYSPSAPPY